MNNNQKSHYSVHQQVSILLPWYVNESLHCDENNFVELHLKSCLVCKIEVTNLQKLATSISSEESLAPVTQTSFLQLKKRIQQSEVPTRQSTGKFAVFSEYFQWFTKVDLKKLVIQHQGFVLAFAFLVTFLLYVPGYLVTKPISGNKFHTLSSTKHIARTPLKNEIRLVFSTDITQQQITQILASVHGEIVSGPTPQGVFIVRVGISSKDLLETVSLLRNNSHVIFAEPTFAFLSPKNKSPG
jgi:hypothetical protein